MLKSNKIASNNYLIKQLPKATAFVDKNLQVVFVSDKWVADFDFINHTVLGKRITSLFRNHNKDWQQIFKKCLKDCPNQITIERYIDSQGNEKWFEAQTIPWHDDQENVIGTILQTQDITKRRLTESKLEKLQLISEQMSDVAKIGFWDYNVGQDQMFWCDKTRAIHEVDEDYKPNMIDATNFYTNGYSRNTISMTVNKAIINETSFHEKVQIITAKGNEIWVISSGKPLYKNGKFIGLVGTIQDTNDINIAELKQRENEHLLRTLIDNLPLNVFIKDLESRKILVNKAEVEFCELKDESEILGKDDFAVYDTEIAEKFRKDDLIVMRDLKPILDQETVHTKKDGTTITFLSSKMPLIDTDGHAYGLVGISMDISDFKQKEAELHDLINVTSLQNEKLINFAHIVSHNLRSHTSNFSMLLNFLCNENCEIERQSILNMLVESSDNLLETMDNLNEVIDISTKTDLKRKSTILKNKITAMEQSLSADLITHNATIINNVTPKVKIKVIPAYIDSILNNFLTNAIKYKSPDRDPVITLSTKKEPNYTVLSISDNGLGIDLKKYGDKLFGMYKTFHDRPDSKGIGLYITKNQIEAMNGKVEVASEVGKGTTFKIYFNDEN